MRVLGKAVVFRLGGRISYRYRIYLPRLTLGPAWLQQRESSEVRALSAKLFHGLWERSLALTAGDRRRRGLLRGKRRG